MKPLVVLIILIGTISCSSPSKVDYSFFAAGHTYGNPMDEAHPLGLYKPFKEKISFINEDKKLKTGFLLGDVVWKPSNWDTTVKDISLFEDSIHVVRGNHDGSFFEKHFLHCRYR